MLAIDTSDCRLEIGVGNKFMRTLTWHFSQFLRANLVEKCGGVSFETVAVDREARRMASCFVADMQDYFQQTLSDIYEDMENLGPEGIVDLYVQENLGDYQADYLKNHLAGFEESCRQQALPAGHVEPATIAAVVCH